MSELNTLEEIVELTQYLLDGGELEYELMNGSWSKPSTNKPNFGYVRYRKKKVKTSILEQAAREYAEKEYLHSDEIQDGVDDFKAGAEYAWVNPKENNDD